MIWIALIGIVILVLFFEKFKDMKKVFLPIFLIGIILLIYFSISPKLKAQELEFNSPKAILNSVMVYSSIIGESIMSVINTGKNSVIAVGNVIKGNQTED